MAISIKEKIEILEKYASKNEKLAKIVNLGKKIDSPKLEEEDKKKIRAAIDSAYSKVQELASKKAASVGNITAKKYKNITQMVKALKKQGIGHVEATKEAREYFADLNKKAADATKAAINNFKLQVGRKAYKRATSGTTVQRDIHRPAKPAGKRIVRSSGQTSNQFGGPFPNKKGRVYYESRANRMDVNQPTKDNRNPFPKLANGGKIEDTTYIANRNIETIVIKQDGKVKELTGKDIIDGIYVMKDKLASNQTPSATSSPSKKYLKSTSKTPVTKSSTNDGYRFKTIAEMKKDLGVKVLHLAEIHPDFKELEGKPISKELFDKIKASEKTFEMINVNDYGFNTQWNDKWFISPNTVIMDKSATSPNLAKSKKKKLVADSKTNEFVDPTDAKNAVIEFENKYGISVSKIASEYNALPVKQADIAVIYERFSENRNPYPNTEEFLQLLLSGLSAEGIKLKYPIGYLSEGFEHGGKMLPVNFVARKQTPMKLYGVESMATLVVKDDLRPAMMGVHFEDGKMVATDAHKLAMVKISQTPKEIYDIALKAGIKDFAKTGLTPTEELAKLRLIGVDEKVEGKTIDFKIGMEVVDPKYPNYKAVIPTNREIYTDEIDLQEFIDAVSGADFALKNASRQVRVFKIDFVGEESIEMGFQCSFVLELLLVLQANGAKTINISVESPNRAAIVNCDNGDLGMLMPLMKDDSGMLASTVPITLKTHHKSISKKKMKRGGTIVSSKDNDFAAILDEAYHRGPTSNEIDGE